jgi:hypothetical protein
MLKALVLPVRSHGLHQQDFHSAPGTIVVRLVDEANDRVALRYDERLSYSPRSEREKHDQTMVTRLTNQRAIFSDDALGLLSRNSATATLTRLYCV